MFEARVIQSLRESRHAPELKQQLWDAYGLNATTKARAGRGLLSPQEAEGLRLYKLVFEDDLHDEQ